jgi:hypothetical protein
MAKIAIYNWNSCLDEVIDRLKEKHTIFVNNVFEDYKDVDVVVMWNEDKRSGWGEKIIEVQKMGKKVVLYQQGVWGIDWVRPPFNEPVISDVVLVWGEGDKRRLISYGTPAEKIVVTGSPIIKHLKPRIEHEGKNVVFALEHWDWGDVVENNIVAAELRKLKDVNIITKGLHRENNTEAFTNPVISMRFSKDHLGIVANVLSRADLVVGLSESTFQFLAQVLDIPVVVADIWMPKERGGDKRYLKFEHNFSNAITKAKLEDLNKTIYHQLKHPEILREERAKAVIDNGGIDIPDPVGNICKVIEKAL